MTAFSENRDPLFLLSDLQFFLEALKKNQGMIYGSGLI